MNHRNIISLLAISCASTLCAQAPDKSVKERLTREFEAIGTASEGRIPVMRGGKWGFCNFSGDIVVDPVFDEALPFSGGLAAVKEGKAWGYIDPDGFPEVSCKYEQVRPYSEGMAAVKRDGKWGFIDRDGFPKIRCQYDEVSDFNEGRAQVTLAGKKLTISPAGSQVD